MIELEITAKRLAQVWWLMIWRSIAIFVSVTFCWTIICGILLRLLRGFIIHLSFALEQQAVSFLVKSFLPVAAIFASVFAVRMALKKKYKGFRISLLPPNS
jgi:uncharacterized membrane protein